VGRRRAKTRQGQISPQDAQARAEAFGKKVQDKMEELGVVVVHNADQAGTAVCAVVILLRLVLTFGYSCYV
jgi:sorbitol-specific phosphotransferase system component IIA